jgi:ABC-type nitrate/sulfonate/bicarbonate transport system permease component
MAMTTESRPVDQRLVPIGLSAAQGQAAGPVRRGARRRGRAASSSMVSLVVAAVLLATWEALSASHLVSRVALPSPLHVLRDFVHTLVVGYGGTTLLGQAEISILRISGGFVAAVILGVPIGLAMGGSRFIHAAVDPLLQFLRPVPPLAFIPLLVIWFGIGELSKVLLIFFCTLPVVIINTATGVAAIQPLHLRVAQCLGANRWQLFGRVVLPSVLPQIFTGMRVGIGIAWTCLVAAEMVAASRGLGWMVMQAGNNLQSGIVFVAIISIGVLGYGMDLLLRLGERWAVPWKGRA